MESNTKISKFIEADGKFRVAVVVGTTAVQKMCGIQNTGPLASMFLGRALVGAALLAAHLKEEELVSLYFTGNGPIESVFAEAHYEGAARAYTPHPRLQLALKNNRLDLAGAIGKGTLSVVRTHGKGHQPYRGTVELQTGEVGDDLAFYLHQSHQVRSVVSLGIKLSEFGKVEGAGGVLIELMPNADILIENIIAERVREASSLSDAIVQGKTAEEIAQIYLDGFKLQELDHPYHLEYSCKCDLSRVLRSLQLLPLEELDEIIAKKEVLSVKCEFCGLEYKVQPSEAQEIRDEKYRNSLN